MTLDLWTFDVGAAADSPESFAEECLRRAEESWAGGAEIVLFPEFLWVGLERFVTGGQPLREVSQLFWGELMPRIQVRFADSSKAAVLGTVPFWDEKNARLHNRSPIFSAGRWLQQDKLHLTPWETAFSPGEALTIWEHGGLRIAVVICLDIEVPELSAALRGRGVDLILCPSATETLLGVERVDRCASARAVELGCQVAVAHLAGAADSDLIDANVGRVAVYNPSQSPFADEPRWIEGDVETDGFHRLRVEIEPQKLAAMREKACETNPSLLKITATPAVKSAPPSPAAG